MAGGKPGFVISERPARYKNTPQQERFKKAADFCGIRKGITREELLTAMTTCIPEYYRQVKEGRDPSLPSDYGAKNGQ